MNNFKFTVNTSNNNLLNIPLKKGEIVFARLHQFAIGVLQMQEEFKQEVNK